MTVADLKELLSNYNDNQEIKFAVPTNCYWRRTKAVDISDIEEAEIAYSDYYRSDIIKEDEDSNKKTKPCLILR